MKTSKTKYNAGSNCKAEVKRNARKLMDCLGIKIIDTDRNIVLNKIRTVQFT